MSLYYHKSSNRKSPASTQTPSVTVLVLEAWLVASITEFTLGYEVTVCRPHVLYGVDLHCFGALLLLIYETLFYLICIVLIFLCFYFDAYHYVICDHAVGNSIPLSFSVFVLSFTEFTDFTDIQWHTTSKHMSSNAAACL